MTYSIRRSIVYTAFTLLLFATALLPITFASEVTGTLSSDGSSEVTGTNIMQVNDKQGNLSGTVLGAADGDNENVDILLTIALWSIPVVAAAGIVLGMNAWRRRTLQRTLSS